MFIDNVNYKTDLTDIQNIRYLLFLNLYGNKVYTDMLLNIISRHIDCLSIDYSPNEYTFTIKIKKTTMRKYHGFDHNPNYYYNTIHNIFKEFINQNSSVIEDILRSNNYSNPKEIINKFNNGIYCIENLCHVSCIADNILVIKL